MNTYNSADGEIEKAQKSSSEILTAISSKMSHLNPSGMSQDSERSRVGGGDILVFGEDRKGA